MTEYANSPSEVKDMGNPVPEQFDWVRARGKCSIQTMFKDLELGVKGDIQSWESLFPASQVKFSVRKNGSSRFSVVRIDNPMTSDSQSIDFVRESGAIGVYDDGGRAVLAATLTLNNQGECQLRIGDEELNQWQFRRRALEKLFFET